ncbi:MAG: serine/threonine-protein kinase [Kofleriaceae bacterium]
MGEQFPIPFGRYQLIERLAVGGMAELFVATVGGEHGFAKKVVIKRLLPHLGVDPNYTQMFIDEAKLTARLVHPKIAQTHELGRVGNELFIAMEFVDGFDVLAMLRECAHRREQLEHHIAVWIAREVLDALDFAHQATDAEGNAIGVVHRDISPSNVLLSVRGDVKLIDFGIARAHDPQRAQTTKSGTLKGKYGYMSPEQVVEQPLDPRTDLFSVGVVLAEMLTGRRLFAAANELDVLLMVRDARLTRLDKYGEGIDPGLDVVVRTALKKNLDERWQSAAAFRDALDEWLFMQRRRVSAKMVADLVAVLREGVISQRARDQASDALAEPEPVAAPVAAAMAAATAAADRVATVEAPPRASAAVLTVSTTPVVSTAPPVSTVSTMSTASPAPVPRPTRAGPQRRWRCRGRRRRAAGHPHPDRRRRRAGSRASSPRRRRRPAAASTTSSTSAR